jgi:iron complex outermembrane receptor protein
VFYSNESGSDTQVARVGPVVVPLIFFNDGAKIINKSWSLYTQNDFKLTDKLSITLGGRYTEERKGLVSRNRNFLPATGLYICSTGVVGANGQALVTTDPQACTIRNEATFSGYSYLASANYHVTPDVLLYAKTAKGFRGGAFQLRAPTLAPAGPETAKDVELGLKSEWLQRRLRANFAVYQTKYGNKQESTVISTPSGALATVIQNAADATLKGMELELTANPMERLTLSATAAYIRGKYDRFPGALPIQGGALVDASGERFSIPPWSYSLTARYVAPVPGGNLSLQADWAWTDGARPPPRLVNPGIPKAVIDEMVAGINGGSFANGRNDLGLLNARIDYEMAGRGLTVSLFMTNVLDHKYQFSSVDPGALGVFAGITGAPRMYGITVKKTFGEE